MPSKPTHEQAQLQLYDLRREARLRQARDWYFKNYFVDTLDDAMRIAAPGSEGGTNTMMVWSYWEQACALLNHGLLHEDLFFETSGEFFGVWERVKPILAEGRQRFADPHFLENLEKAAQRFEKWSDARSPGHLAAMRQFMEQMRRQAAKAAYGGPEKQQPTSLLPRAPRQQARSPFGTYHGLNYFVLPALRADFFFGVFSLGFMNAP